MPLKTVFAPSLGRDVAFGCKLKPAGHTFGPRDRLKLLTTSLPAPPAEFDYWTPAADPVERNVEGNDQIGDCVIAWILHSLGLVQYAACNGPPFAATLTQAVQLYSAIGGYVPGNPWTDNGCDPTVALDYLVRTGYPDGTKVLGWLPVDGSDVATIQLFLWLNAFVGTAMAMPDAWLASMPRADGFVWDTAGPADPNNGHMICVTGRARGGWLVNTWALRGLITDAAGAKYGSSANQGQFYVAITDALVNRVSGLVPAGFDWPTAVGFWDAMGGKLPTPAPTPTPVPTPAAPQFLRVTGVSPTSVTLQWAEADPVDSFTVYGPSTVTGVMGVPYTVTGLKPDTPYTFAVAGVRNGVLGRTSASVSARTLPVAAHTLQVAADGGQPVTYNVYPSWPPVAGSVPVSVNAGRLRMAGQGVPVT